MERMFIALIIMHVSSSQVQENFTEGTKSRLVQLGDTVVLHCDVKHDVETIWHGQRCDKVPFMIIAAKDKPGSSGKTKTKYFRGYDPRFRLELLSGNKSVGLEITNLTISDLGLYYCTTSPNVRMLTGLATKLVLADHRDLPATVTNGSVVLIDGPEAGPWVPLHCRILLAILCPVCTMLGALLYSAYLHCRKSKFFFNFIAGSESCETRITSMNRNTDGEEEEADVIYTTLKIPSRKSGLTRQMRDTE